MSEYGKLCESCRKRVPSRQYPFLCFGIKGKDANILRYRKICKSCWFDKRIHSINFKDNSNEKI